jgi:thioredoxin reductase
MISRRKLLLGGLLLTGGLLAGSSKKIAAADTKKAEVFPLKPDRAYEAGVIGGGFAGLQAALTLGRACRSVILFDAKSPRNSSALPIHNFIGRDGAEQSQLFSEAREQLKRYNVTFCDELIVDASRQSEMECFILSTASGIKFICDNLLLATGAKDKLPQVKGMTEFWGRGVYSCPFCSGWEVRNKPLAVYGINNGAALAAVTLKGWSREVALLTDGKAELNEESLSYLKKHGILLVEDKIDCLEGQTTLQSILLANGKRITGEGIFLQPSETHNCPLFNSLGAKLNSWGLPVLDARGQTSVPGVYVAGDASGKPFQAIGAAADGASVAFAMARALISNKQKSS